MSTLINEKIEARMGEMVNKPFMYRAMNYKIHSFEVDNKTVIVKTDTRDIKLDVSTLAKSLDEFLPVEEDRTPKTSVSLQAPKGEVLDIMIHDQGNLEKLETILMNNIEKLQNNEKFLPQAKEINSHTNTIIKLAKTKIDMVREIRKVNRN